MTQLELFQEPVTQTGPVKPDFGFFYGLPSNKRERILLSMIKGIREWNPKPQIIENMRAVDILSYASCLPRYLAPRGLPDEARDLLKESPEKLATYLIQNSNKCLLKFLEGNITGTLESALQDPIEKLSKPTVGSIRNSISNREPKYFWDFKAMNREKERDNAQMYYSFHYWGDILPGSVQMKQRNKHYDLSKKAATYIAKKLNQ